MEKISEMIKRLRPKGVERIPLKEVTITQAKGGITKGDLCKEGKYPVVNSAREIIGYLDKNNNEEDTIVITSHGAYAGFCHYLTSKFWAGGLCFPLKSVDQGATKYLYYYIKEKENFIRNNYVNQSGVPYINYSNLGNLCIPFPPLSIQQEIVRILDSFTSMITNLETELASRQKQYEYYRDNLFSEDLETLLERTDCDVKTIGDLGSLTRGKRFVRTDIVENGVPCIHYGDMYTYYGLKAETANTHITPEKAKSMRFAKKGDVVIVGAGENDWDIGVGLVWKGEEPAAIHDACYILEHNQNPMYISHYLRSTVYHLQLRKYVSSGKISSFAAKDLAKIYIPIPSLNRQQEIVSTLDTFESLITNIKQELEARKKQYEYYREQLLTFE